MQDKDKLVTLIRLRDLLYFLVQPTLRQCGFPSEIVHELAEGGLIRLRDKKCGDDPDRYVIEEILPDSALRRMAELALSPYLPLALGMISSHKSTHAASGLSICVPSSASIGA